MNAFRLALFAALAFPALHVMSQCYPHHSTELECNQVKTIIQNGGDQWWDLISGGGPVYRTRYEVPIGSGMSAGYAGAFWIGGLDSAGTLHMAANTYRQTGIDFYSGPLRESVAYDCGFELETGEYLNLSTYLQLADGRMILAHNHGYTLFDESTGTVTSIPFLGMAPESQCLQLQDGRIISIVDMPASAPDLVVVMDTLTFTPAVACTLAGNYLHPSMTELSTGEVLLISLATERLDPVTLAPTLLSTTPSRHSNRTILFPGDSVLVVGGALGTTTQWYVPSSGTFVPGPVMSEARFRFGMAELPSGDYLLAGGNDGNTSEIFDITTRTFSPGPLTENYLGEATALALPSGDILFAGELEREVFSVSSSTFDAKRLNGSWRGQGLLPSGKVLMQMTATACRIYDPVTDLLEGQPLQSLWSLTQDQIDMFLSDHAAGTVDYTKYRDIQNWPAHGDTLQGENYHLAPFVDPNGDGHYNADDGDYPCITGNQSIWYVFHDDGAHTETASTDALGVEIEFLAYGFDCSTTACPDSFMDYTTFYHYEITNTKGQDYHDVYLGYWADMDLGGNWTDDYVGCDSVSNLGFIFNADAYDESTYGPGYGLHPPATGIVFLNTPYDLGLTHCMAWDASWVPTGHPEEVTDFYGYMKAEWKDSTHLVNNGSDGYSGTASGPSVNHIFPGNAGWCGNTAVGWSEVTAMNTPGDRRLLLSSGPFYLPADTTLTFDFATVWARGYFNDNLGSVCKLRTASDAISTWWKAQDFTCFGVTTHAETPVVSAREVEVYPNPASQQFEVRFPEVLAADAELYLQDVSGRLVLRQKVARGTQLTQVSCAGLSSGLYQLRCKVGGEVFVKKVIVSQD